MLKRLLNAFSGMFTTGAVSEEVRPYSGLIDVYAPKDAYASTASAKPRLSRKARMLKKKRGY